MIYLDNAATTVVCQEAADAARSFMLNRYGNPGTLHFHGRDAANAMDVFRKTVADFVRAEPDQILFTSGGSESNSLALRGVSSHLFQIGKPHVITSATEHDSVLNAVRELRKSGHPVTILPVGEDGVVRMSDIMSAVTPSTGLISIMYSNNETGAVNPVDEIGDLCAKRDILFHTDCVQAAGCIALDVNKIGCDMLSISGHKLHAPKGTGALYVRDRFILHPLIHGGANQEFGLRAGTENVPGIAGLAAAISTLDVHETCIWTSTLKQRFFMAVQSRLKDAGYSDRLHVNGPSVITPGKTLNVRVDGVDGQSLLLMLSSVGVCCSAGSACTSRENKPSHVLKAMGFTDDQARSSLRFSFSKYNTVEEILAAADAFSDCVEALLGGTPNEREN